MKALTLWQPWAHAIAHLGKRVENRTWAPPRGTVGTTIAIHAGLAVDAAALEDIRRAGHRLPAAGQLPRRAVVCVARVVAVVRPVRPDEVPAATRPPYYLITDACVPPARVHELLGVNEGLWYSGGIGWVLDDVVALARPVDVSGSQGLWTLGASVAQDVDDEVQFALRTGRGRVGAATP